MPFIINSILGSCEEVPIEDNYNGYGTDITNVLGHDVVRRYMLLGAEAELSEEEISLLESLPGPHLWNIYEHINDDVEIIQLEYNEPKQFPNYSFYDDENFGEFQIFSSNDLCSFKIKLEF